MDGHSASRERAILPRVSFASGVMRDAADELRGDAARLASGPGGGPAGLECGLRAAALALEEARARLAAFDRVGAVPAAAAVPASAVRAVSAMVHGTHPGLSGRLSEASSVLGSVLTDSALLAGASLDFGSARRDSSALVERAAAAARSETAAPRRPRPAPRARAAGGGGRGR